MVELNTAVLHFTFMLLLNHVIAYTKINHWLICWYKISILDNRSNSLVKKISFLNDNLLYYSYFNTTGNPPETPLLLNSTRGSYLHKKYE